MKHVPKLFNTEMVRAILANTKNQTRRTKGLVKINENPDKWIFDGWARDIFHSGKFARFVDQKGKMPMDAIPETQLGDIFWVRETWAEAGSFASNEFANSEVIAYRTEHAVFYDTKSPLDTFAWNWDKIKWKPSIFMPKEACRIFLKVTDVRVERLHDISEEDAKAEGVKSAECETIEGCWGCKEVCQSAGTYWDYMNPSGECGFPSESAKESFFTLWQSINGRESLDANPWVFVYDFEQIEKPKNFLK